MAAPSHSPSSYAHGYHPTQHLPPSPPPSPPATRRRHRKKPDPFDALATTPIPSIPSSPTNEPDDAKEPLLIRIILTPILFTSFLVSLFLVNYRNRARRREAHSPSSTSLLTYLFPSTWLDPEPYQDPGDSTWDRRGTAHHAEPHDAISPRREAQGEEKKPGKKRKSSWHLHKKIRKVAKLEIGDALEMRGRVIVGMAAVMVLTCAALCMGLKWCFMFISHALSGAKA